MSSASANFFPDRAVCKAACLFSQSTPPPIHDHGRHLQLAPKALSEIVEALSSHASPRSFAPWFRSVSTPQPIPSKCLSPPALQRLLSASQKWCSHRTRRHRVLQNADSVFTVLWVFFLTQWHENVSVAAARSARLALLSH